MGICERKEVGNMSKGIIDKDEFKEYQSNEFPICPKDKVIITGRIYCQNCTEIKTCSEYKKLLKLNIK